MSKYIKQDDVFELVRKGVLISNGNFESVCKHIGILSTIDIVQCGECKHRQKDVGMGDHRWCDIVNGSRRSDDFCSYGEKERQ